MRAPEIIPARLAQVTTLAHGDHDNFEDGACAMEAVAWIAGEPYSDHPACASPVIGAFMRAWNDGLPQAQRDALVLPLISRLLGTRRCEAIENRRAIMAADWLVRVHAPAGLKLPGIKAQAGALSNLPKIVDFAGTPSFRGPLEVAQKDSASACTLDDRGPRSVGQSSGERVNESPRSSGDGASLLCRLIRERSSIRCLVAVRLADCSTRPKPQSSRLPRRAMTSWSERRWTGFGGRWNLGPLYRSAATRGPAPNRLAHLARDLAYVAEASAWLWANGPKITPSAL